MRTQWLIAVLLFLGVAAPGFSQGGFGGGMGQSIEDGDASLSTNILTPGQFTEYPLTGKAGEVIFAEALTTNFDAALQVVDAAGKVLAENDDARPGDQNAQLLFRFPTPGAYKVLVRAFKGAAGGQFNLRMRRFMPKDLVFEKPEANSESAGLFSYYRISAEKDQTIVINTRFVNSSPQLQLFSPSGEYLSPLRNVHPDAHRFLIPQKGDYFLRVATNRAFTLSVAVMKPIPYVLGSEAPERTLKPGGGDIWRFSGKAGQLIQCRTTCPVVIRAQMDSYTRVGMSLVAASNFFQMGQNRKETNTFVGILKQDGIYEVSVFAPIDKEISYRFLIDFPAKAWTDNTNSGILPKGGVNYFLISGKSGDIVKLDATSDQFDTVLDFYDIEGNLLLRDDDGGGNKNSRITKLLTKTGTYLLRIFCNGDGGGGPYALKRTLIAPKALTMGKKETGALVSSEPEVWSFTGTAGQSMILNARADGFGGHLSVFGPDGAPVRGAASDGTNCLLVCKLPKSGVYTVWISGKSESGKYTLRLMDAE